MSIKDSITKKLWQATSDKTELNRKVLKWKRSFAEVNTVLDKGKKKQDKKE